MTNDDLLLAAADKLIGWGIPYLQIALQLDAAGTKNEQMLVMPCYALEDALLKRGWGLYWDNEYQCIPPKDSEPVRDSSRLRAALLAAYEETK